MFIRCVPVFLLTIGCIGVLNGQDDKFFRNDYKYIRDTESFYKVHTLPRTWEEAKFQCETEGASLFFPEDSDEAEVVRSYWNETQPSIKWVFVGIATWNAKDVFDTIDGRPISDVYDAWGPGEPNNAGGVEGCVVMRKDDGTLNDENCRRRTQFICKKPLGTLQWNTFCDLPDPRYVYSDILNRCYKFHLAPKNWTDAYAVCRAEQSYMAIINSNLEAEYLVNLTANAPKDEIKGNYLRGAVHLGFKNQDGWITVQGVPLHQSGYNNWGYGQPDGGEVENCGSMFYNGQLNDIGCFHKMFFICEHEVPYRKEDITLRFNDSSESKSINIIDVTPLK